MAGRVCVQSCRLKPLLERDTASSACCTSASACRRSSDPAHNTRPPFRRSNLLTYGRSQKTNLLKPQVYASQPPKGTHKPTGSLASLGKKDSSLYHRIDTVVQY